jgi:hypothetical protein
MKLDIGPAAVEQPLFIAFFHRPKDGEDQLHVLLCAHDVLPFSAEYRRG